MNRIQKTILNWRWWLCLPVVTAMTVLVIVFFPIGALGDILSQVYVQFTNFARTKIVTPLFDFAYGR